MKTAILLLSVALSGCASLAPNPDEWTTLERSAFAYSATGHGVDFASSAMSDERCVEQNLVLGDSPSNAALFAVKALALGIEYAVYNSPNIDSENTHWLGFTSGTIHLGFGISNFQNDCY